MAFDYKKEYKEFYLPKNKPSIVTISPMNFIAVRGSGDPNLEGGAYKKAISILYGIAYTLKMSKKGGRQIEGYFDYVVPPLEGLWWQRQTSGDDSSSDAAQGIDYSRKDAFEWISVIRLPDFVTEEDFAWAVEEASRKKNDNYSAAAFFSYEEGLCVQCMHIGSYDDEPATIVLMHRYMEEQGFELDLSDTRHHHEIYLSDARKVAPDRLKTVIRHPIRRRGAL